MHLTVVGNPASRRVAMYADAARAAGLAQPDVLPWQTVLAGASLELTPDSLVRVESPGEDAEVDRLLRGADRLARHGEIVGGRAWYAGLCAALDRLADAAAGVGAVLLNDPSDVRVLFDKRACHARLAAAGIPVPAALPVEISGWGKLRAGMDAAGWRRVFVKPRHGSSASGVVALQRSGGRVRAVTSVEVDGDRLFNSLRVREYTDEVVVGRIVDRLAGDGLHVERWYPKAGVGGRRFDLRVLVIAGRPAHTAVRTSRYPMTNLHLGGLRGDLAAVRARVGEEGWGRALHTCRLTAGCFPGSLHVGVDLMIGSDFAGHAVAEANAFGDLLPRLLVNGQDSYGAELAALQAGWRPQPRAAAANVAVQDDRGAGRADLSLADVANRGTAGMGARQPVPAATAVAQLTGSAV